MHVDAVRDYIRNQPEHHQHEDFKTECQRFYENNGKPLDSDTHGIDSPFKAKFRPYRPSLIKYCIVNPGRRSSDSLQPGLSQVDLSPETEYRRVRELCTEGEALAQAGEGRISAAINDKGATGIAERIPSILSNNGYLELWLRAENESILDNYRANQILPKGYALSAKSDLDANAKPIIIQIIQHEKTASGNESG